MSHIRRDINLPNGRGNFFKPGGTGFKSQQQSSTFRRSSALSSLNNRVILPRVGAMLCRAGSHNAWAKLVCNQVG